MASKSSPALYRLNSVDRRGRQIDPVVLAAAEEIFQGALDYSLNVLGDSAAVANMLEEVAARITRQLKSNDPPGEPAPIHNLAAYLFRAFVRDVNRLRSKQVVLVNCKTATPWTDPSRQLENKILTDEFLARFDPVAQDMFAFRMQGFSWDEIGPIYGISAHAAEKRFSKAFRRALARLKMIKRSRSRKTDTGGTL